jgi:hypothetical protein
MSEQPTLGTDGLPAGSCGVWAKDKNAAPNNIANASATVALDGVTPCPKPRELDFDAIPENDPATCDVIAAMCSAGAGFYHVSAYVEEAKRWGITALLPSANHSRMEYTVEAADNGKRALRVGLMQIKGLRIETITAIVRAREETGPFRSREDFLRRVPVEGDEIEALIKCGAFDEMLDEAHSDTQKNDPPRNALAVESPTSIRQRRARERSSLLNNVATRKNRYLVC